MVLIEHQPYRIEKIPPTLLSLPEQTHKLSHFLFNSLGTYTDPVDEIQSCLDYVVDPSKGGYVYQAISVDNELMGVVVLTKTNMHKFVPDYLLVYIATAEKFRGQGLGKALIEFVRADVKAPIALHVEHDNPAKRLYQRLGFTSKYAEMRWYP